MATGKIQHESCGPGRALRWRRRPEIKNSPERCDESRDPSENPRSKVTPRRLRRSYLRHQPIPFLRHRLDESRIRGVVAQRFPQLPDRVRERSVGDEDSRPHFLDDLFLWDHLARVLGEADEDLHDPGIEAHSLAAAHNLVLVRPHQPVA